jgi:DEAD/DEAH box helicase domain-containing protein
MIPSILSRELKEAIKGYLRATFPLTTPFFHGLVDRFLEEEGKLFKGPYISVNLPFVRSPQAQNFFSDISLDFPPYLHQKLAWDRVSAPNPRPTIIATGTGSGKTECFLLPILQHCIEQKRRGKGGIKAILLYPMNALASDQARRIAKLISENPALFNSGLRAGIYIGGYSDKSEDRLVKVMSKDSIINDRETLRTAPPDILLTNYKMLDYMLIRKEDLNLWAQQEPETLQYLVVDELHTFDGAQGTDLSCLIRRLKNRLQTPKNFLCSIGTSATMGDPSDATNLLSFAEKIFSESFEGNSVIGESRVEPGEYLQDHIATSFDLFSADEFETVKPSNFVNRVKAILALSRFRYLDAPDSEPDTDRFRLWLGGKLREDLAFHNLLKILNNRVTDTSLVLKKLAPCTPSLKDMEPSQKEEWLYSILALISHASFKGDHGNENLDVRVQVWMRELKRMVCLLEEGDGSESDKPLGAKPRLCHSDDLMQEDLEKALPILHCRDCGSAALGGFFRKDGDNTVKTGLQEFYQRFFSRSPNVLALYPTEAEGGFCQQEKEGSFSTDGSDLLRLCTRCLTHHPDYNDTLCKSCGHGGYLRVHWPKESLIRQGQNKREFCPDCPYCGSQNGLTILGAQAASLTSVLIDRLFGSQFNQDKKLLTFSDSVQDAAHRAGFFQARTWSTSFRIAILQVIRANEQDLKLSDLLTTAWKFWRKNIDEAELVATLLPTDLHWFNDYQHLVETGEVKPRLLEDLKRRLSWEVLTEFGLRNRIGRTLTRVGSAVISPDPELFKQAQDVVEHRLRSKVAALHSVNSLILRHFLQGFLQKLADEGGFFSGILQRYMFKGVEAWGKARPKRWKWMPPYSRTHGRRPFYLSIKGSDTSLGLNSKNPKRLTWFDTWAMKCFKKEAQLVGGDFSTLLYQAVIDSLIETGILQVHDAENKLQEKDHNPIYSLLSSAFIVGKRVEILRCDKCHHRLSICSDELDSWKGSPCLLSHCQQGRYIEAENPLDWYKEFYAHADLQRIFTAEHTGLLSREDREDIEERFKKSTDERAPWDPNILSCTPTLEMGIDIGDLSSLILCSIPPRESSYLQRIGRSGRRDGNSINVAIANARPHDQYFYENPALMFAGNIKTPGIFLSAASVLKRQMLAYAMGEWIRLKPEAKIPKKMGEVLKNIAPYVKAFDAKQSKQEGPSRKIFPYNFVDWFEDEDTGILDGFLALFVDELDSSCRKALKAIFEGDDPSGTPGRALIDDLYEDCRSRQRLEGRRNSYTSAINAKKNAPKDKNTEDDLKALKQERAALTRLLKTMREKNVYQHLCDLGKLPNYAFPEAGVTLSSLIIREARNKDENDDRDYEAIEYSFERGAQVALKEFAPGNWFYAGGRKVQIDQVDLRDNSEEHWRFCPDCPHCEKVIDPQPPSECPICKNAQFSDQGQVKTLLRLKNVMATEQDRYARISDDSDERKIEFYVQKMLVEIKEVDEKRVWKIPSDDLPFGFDFLTRASFRDFNFGRRVDGNADDEQIQVAGDLSVKPGFEVCPSCGKVQGIKFSKEDAGQHSRLCKDYGKAKDRTKAALRCLWLYREFDSEAVRFLIPFDMLASAKSSEASFLAAIDLSLRLQYEGSIDHIRSTTQECPESQGGGRRTYLILYDTVPGGTGYLQKLFEEDQDGKPAIIAILKRALNHLKNCACNQDPERDGCYQCVYSYHSASKMDHSSRDLARKILSTILAEADKVHKIQNLDEITGNFLEESELERMFLQVLARYEGRKKLRRATHCGKPCLLFKAGDKRSWVIEQQINLGPSDGVAVKSRVDFLISPRKSDTSYKPIVVFTDGWSFHKDRLPIDVSQRQALLLSGRFRVFSIGYENVNEKLNKSHTRDWDDLYQPPPHAKALSFCNLTLEKYGLKNDETSPVKVSNPCSFTALDLLLAHLQNPEMDFTKLAAAWCFGLLDMKQLQSDPVSIEGYKELGADFGAEPFDRLQKSEPSLLLSKCKTARLHLLQFFTHDQVRRWFVDPATAQADLPQVHLILDDHHCENEELQDSWYGWIRAANLLQFFGPAFFYTVETAHDSEQMGDLLDLWEGIIEPTLVDHQAKLPDDWSEAIDDTLPAFKECLRALEKENCLVPEIGFELTEGIEVIGEVECFWSDFNLGILTNENSALVEKGSELGLELLVLEGDPKRIQNRVLKLLQSARDS